MKAMRETTEVAVRAIDDAAAAMEDMALVAAQNSDVHKVHRVMTEVIRLRRLAQRYHRGDT